MKETVPRGDVRAFQLFTPRGLIVIRRSLWSDLFFHTSEWRETSLAPSGRHVVRKYNAALYASFFFYHETTKQSSNQLKQPHFVHAAAVARSHIDTKKDPRHELDNLLWDDEVVNHAKNERVENHAANNIIRSILQFGSTRCSQSAATLRHDGPGSERHPWFPPQKSQRDPSVGFVDDCRK